MKFLIVTLIAIIAACIVMFGYLMLYIPWECSNLAILTGGHTSCGLEPGAYLIAAISVIIAIIASAMLFREWKKDRTV